MSLKQMLDSRNTPLFSSGKFADKALFLDKLSTTTLALKAEKAQRFLLFADELEDFAVYFFALICAGKHIVLPPSDKPGQLHSLFEHIDMTIGSCTVPKKPHFQNDFSGADTAQEPLTLDNKVTLDFFTSGSTGNPKQVRKRFGQLCCEVFDLEMLWGEQLKQTQVLATVSHQHIYGLIFKLLWPLLTGRTISPDTLLYPEDLSAQLMHNDSVVLVSSPAFLTRTLDEPLWQANQAKFAMIFSSGGPLPTQTALAIGQQAGFAPIEVLGSTETGGIAWRRQQGEGPYLWQAFDNVDIRIEADSQRLSLNSPYLHEPQWYVTDDRADIQSDGRFELLGRADRIVKIEEKRLSLDELEQQLSTHAYIKRCYALTLQGNRTVVGCVCELSQSGKQAYSEHNKRYVNQVLKQHLSQYFEAVLLPRKWRYVETIPQNSQGKIEKLKIAELFESHANQT